MWRPATLVLLWIFLGSCEGYDRHRSEPRSEPIPWERKALDWMPPQRLGDSATGLIWPQDVQILGDRILVWWKDDLGIYVQESRDEGETWTAPSRIADIGVWTTFGYAGWIIHRVAPPHLYQVRNTWEDLFFSRSEVTEEAIGPETEIPRKGLKETKIEEPYSAVFKRNMKGYRGPLHSDYVRILARGDDIYVLSPTDYPYMMLFTRSGDGGRTWEPYTVLEEAIYEEDSPRAGMYLYGTTLHAFYTRILRDPAMEQEQEKVARNSVVVHATSQDGGRRWKKERLDSVFRGGSWVARDFDIEVAGNTVHMVFCTYRDATFYYTSSRDGGETWAPAVKLVKSCYSDLMMCFDLQVYGNKLLFSHTRPRPIRYPENLLSDDAMILMSEDGGTTWRQLDFDAGVSEEIRLPIIRFVNDKTCYVIYETGPGELIFAKKNEFYRTFPGRRSELWFRKGTIR